MLQGMRWGPLLPLLLAALLFSLAACWRLSLPGLQYDECLGAAPAVNFVRGTENAEPMHIRPSMIHPFGRPLPVMVMPYIGPVKLLLHIPLLATLGISTVTVRLLPLLAGLVSLGCAWWICRRLWSRVVADTTVLLLALDPSWVFYLTRDVGPAALAVLLKLLAVVAGLRWWRHGRRRDLLATAFLLGLGVSHKADFLWVVAALAVPWLALAGAPLRSSLVGSRLAGRRGRSLLIAATGFALGAAPVVAFNLATEGRTFGPFLERLLVTERGSFLGSFLPNLGTRLEQTTGLLNGEMVHRLFFGVAGAASAAGPTGPGDVLLWIVPALAAASLLWVSVTSRLGAALALHVAVLVAAACFSPTALRPHHLLALYPALHVAMAVAAVDLGRRLTGLGSGEEPGHQTSGHGRRWRAGIVPAVTVALVGTVNLTAVLSVDRGLRETGGVGLWSDAIVPLAQDLRARGEPVVVMDWGFTDNLIVLTEGEVAMEPAYRELWRHPPAPELFEPYLAEGKLYLFHAPGFEQYAQIPGFFRELAEVHGLEPRVEARFRQRDGRVVARLVRLERPGGAP